MIHLAAKPLALMLAATALIAADESVSDNPSFVAGYADLADVALPAPVALHARIRSAAALRGEQAAGVPAGITRYYVEADVLAVIRGAQGFSTRVTYLTDRPEGRSNAPRRRDERLLLGRAISGRPGELQLASPRADLPYDAATADRLRSLIREATAPGAAPPIVGIGRAFHVPGTLPGESETQIFLLAEGGRPVSLSILRRPGQEPEWAVALGDIVDEAAAMPRPGTLLWYRLACTLPRDLPQASLSEAEPAHVDAIRADYRVVLDSLGPCDRGSKGA